MTCSKGPNLSDLLKGVDLNDLMGSMGDLSQLRDIFSDKKSADAKKTQEKKDDVPDDKKYKS
ncbi:MAG: hypothetical protein MJ223_03130 [Mycoplasmoidaceae bacterium]|nr:hypothetical protein [Mycoplasmoidaceae bacterium]